MLRLVELSEEILQQITTERKDIHIQNSEDLSTIYCLMSNNQCVGTYILKHFPYNNSASKAEILFEIFPVFRHLGYGEKGLELCLQEAQKIGISQVMMTCEKNNEDMYRIIKKVMLKMGGREIVSPQQNNNTNHRIWIETKERHCGKIRTLALAIIQKNGKVLANKGYDDKKNEYFYRLPGGGIEFYETAENALKRELKEENNLDIIVGRQLGVVENIFEFNGKKGHEIAIIFEAYLSDKDAKKDKFPRIEPEFEGCFTEFIDIQSDVNIYPTEALDRLK